MIVDHFLTFSENQAITVTAASTDFYDPRKGVVGSHLRGLLGLSPLDQMLDPGEGATLKMHVHVTEAFDGPANASLTLLMLLAQADPAGGVDFITQFAVAGTAHAIASSQNILTAQLTKDSHHYLPIGRISEGLASEAAAGAGGRFLSPLYIVGNGPFTAGRVTTRLVLQQGTFAERYPTNQRII